LKILDSNLWVFGTLRTNEQAAELLAEIDRGETTSAIFLQRENPIVCDARESLEI